MGHKSSMLKKAMKRDNFNVIVNAFYVFLVTILNNFSTICLNLHFSAMIYACTFILIVYSIKVYDNKVNICHLLIVTRLTKIPYRCYVAFTTRTHFG